MKYLQIHDMQALIKDLVTKRGVIKAVPRLWAYGIEYLGSNRFICVNKSSAFFNKRCCVKPIEAKNLTSKQYKGKK